MPQTKLQRYLRKKERTLNETERSQIRARIERGDGDVHKLAEEFHCVPTQVAGIKARMKF